MKSYSSLFHSVFKKCVSLIILIGLFNLVAMAEVRSQEQYQLKEKEALNFSQNAIGNSVGNLTFRSSHGGQVQLSEYLGKPLVLNFIYTSCVQSCNVNTAWLVDVYDDAQNALGADSFNAVTIGFDTNFDTPGRMRQFASQRSADGIPGWKFLSGDAQAIDQLTKTLGFTYFKSAKGFDHIDQVTLIDADGKVVAQVYGDTFDKPLLIEPLKNLVFGTTAPYRSLDDLIKKIKLFCTLYDPAADRYGFDYSLFIQISIGFLVIGFVIAFLVRELLAQRRNRKPVLKS